MKCEDCSHAEMCKWIDELEGRGCDFGEPCEDAISREDVIDKIRHAEIDFTITSSIDFSEYKREIQEIVDHIVEAQINAINQLPSVTPSRRKGKGELYEGEFGKMESEE